MALDIENYVLTELHKLDIWDNSVNTLPSAPTRDPIFLAKCAGLEELEQKLWRSILSVRTARNSCAPIMRLPTELLELVMSSLISCDSDPRTILCLTHVCHGWRNIAMNSPRLWTLVDFQYPRLAVRCIARSEASPLSVVSSYPQTAGSFVDLLGGHLHRIRRLELRLQHVDAHTHLPMFSTDHPMLEDLSIVVDNPLVRNHGFLCHAHSIRRLELSGVFLPWNACGGSLTHLSLTGLDEEASPSMTQLLRIFERSPQLEEVVLTEISPALPSRASSTEVVALPHLRRFCAAGLPGSTTRLLLSSLDIPETACLRLRYGKNQDITSILPSDLSRLRIFHPPSPNQDIEGELKIANNAVYLYRRPRNKSISQTRSNRPSLEIIGRGQTSGSFSSTVANIIAFSRISILDLANMDVYADYAEFLPPPPNIGESISTLRLSAWPNARVCSLFLCWLSQTQTQVNGAGMALPRLERLEVGNFKLCCMNDARPLLRLLKDRDEIGKRIKWLELTDCELGPGMAEIADGYVGRLRIVN